MISLELSYYPWCWRWFSLLAHHHIDDFGCFLCPYLRFQIWSSYAHSRDGPSSQIGWWESLILRLNANFENIYGLRCCSHLLKMIDPCNGQHPRTYKIASPSSNRNFYKLQIKIWNIVLLQTRVAPICSWNIEKSLCQMGHHDEDKKWLHSGFSLWKRPHGGSLWKRGLNYWCISWKCSSF